LASAQPTIEGARRLEKVMGKNGGDSGGPQRVLQSPDQTKRREKIANTGGETRGQEGVLWSWERKRLTLGKILRGGLKLDELYIKEF